MVPIYSLPIFADIVDSLRLDSMLFEHLPGCDDFDMLVSGSFRPVIVQNVALFTVLKVSKIHYPLFGRLVLFFAEL